MYSSNNKDKRIEMRNAEIERKISEGWKTEIYKDVVFIWTDKEPFLMKAWKGTAYNHLFFYRYRSIESMERKKEEVKKSADYREELKEQWTDDYNVVNVTPWRVFSKCAFPSDASNFRVVRKEDVTCGLTEDFYTIAFDSSLPETQKPKRPELKEGQIKAIEYSDKSIAIIGDTRQFKDELKKLGGKFNFRLSCGAGWIFPKTKANELKSFFESQTKTLANV